MGTAVSIHECEDNIGYSPWLFASIIKSRAPGAYLVVVIRPDASLDFVVLFGAHALAIALGVAGADVRQPQGAERLVSHVNGEDVVCCEKSGGRKK